MNLAYGQIVLPATKIVFRVFNFPYSMMTATQQDLPVSDDRSPNAAIDRRNPELSLQLALAAARTAAENGGTEISVLDMSSQTALFDYFVIITGHNRRQLHAISEEIDHKLEDDLNDKRMSIDGYDQSRWIVLDYSTVVIHMFDPETRDYYSLEALWADAKKVDLSEALSDYPESWKRDQGIE